MKVTFKIYKTQEVKNGSAMIQTPILDSKNEPLYEVLIENVDGYYSDLIAPNKFIRMSDDRLIKINNVYIQTGSKNHSALSGLVVVGHEVELVGSTIEDGRMF